MKLVILLLLGLHLCAAPADEFDGRVLRFNAHWGRFVRAFWGCDTAAHDRKECNPARGRIDRHEFEAARQAAKPLFDLR